MYENRGPLDEATIREDENRILKSLKKIGSSGQTGDGGSKREVRGSELY